MQCCVHRVTRRSRQLNVERETNSLKHNDKSTNIHSGHY